MQTGGAHLRDFHEQVFALRPEEREPRRKSVDVDAGLDAGADVFDAVGQRVSHFQVGGRAGFLHVITGDRDRVELRHVLRGELEDVRDDPHARLGRIDVGVPHHVFLQNVVLDRAGELLLFNALFFRCGDEKRQHGKHRAVHGHRDRHLVERDAVEEHFHVFDGINRDARLADIADNTRMIAVVAAMRREIERDRQAALARREVAAVKGVALGCRREAGVLPDGPRTLHIHRRVRPAQKRRDARVKPRCSQSARSALV